MTHDVIVVGLGAVGAATLYQLSKRGVAAIGIDRFAPPHDHGSSHGETRITRLAVGEGEVYAPLVRRSHEIWRELEAAEGVSLLHQIGGLIMAPRVGAALHHGKDAFVDRTVAVANRFGIVHEVLGADAIRARFPQFVLRGDEVGYFEPEAGFLRPEECVRAQLAAARYHGASVRVDERVLRITQDDRGVTLETERETLRARRCVVAAGAWIGRLLGDRIARQTRVTRQVLHWFAPSDAEAYAPERFPVFIWMHGPTQEDYLYGFPEASPGGGVKLASEQYTHATEADDVERSVSAAETQAFHATHVVGRLRGLPPRALQAKTCLYTVTPDAGFIVSDVPGMDRVLAVSACSGHGFKHSAALGEAVAERVLDGGSRIPLDAFALERLDLSAVRVEPADVVARSTAGLIKTERGLRHVHDHDPHRR